MEDRIERIIKRWFVTEPALFAVICSHEIARNVKMRCPVRSGGGRIECNPDFVREMSDDALEEALRTEVLRIMLKHPYERRPDGCRGEAMVFGSNLVISDNYTFSRFNLQTADGSGFEAGLSYEAYSRKVEKAMEEGVIPSGDPSLRDVSELWDDDPLQIALVNGVLEGIKDWGSLTGDLLESVKASSQASINWKNVLAGFRSSVLSMDRRLTRMRPSRRTGFENMGSVRRFTSRILVALDVSGSVSSEALGYFLGVANSAFKYGITEIDVIQFEMYVTVKDRLRHALKETFAFGRGGTDFQVPVDYAAKGGYDGLVIVTDGEAPPPVIPDNFKAEILWVCESAEAYRKNSGWMSRSGRVCTMRLR